MCGYHALCWGRRATVMPSFGLVLPLISSVRRPGIETWRMRSIGGAFGSHSGPRKIPSSSPAANTEGISPCRITNACSGRGPLRFRLASGLPFRVAGHAAEAQVR
jgi:hypothetical protein